MRMRNKGGQNTYQITTCAMPSEIVENLISCLGEKCMDISGKDVAYVPLKSLLDLSTIMQLSEKGNLAFV